MARILVVEDEKSINDLIVRCLTVNGHTCLTAFTGGEAVSVCSKSVPDLVLLDINLPDGDGFQVMERIGSIPVIYVTARGEIRDRVRGLNGGAEDYIVKPFDVQELIARVNVALRRYHKLDQRFCLGGTEVDLDNYKVYRGSTELSLTKQEFELLRSLVLNKNITMSRERLLESAWGWDYEGDIRTVDVHVQRLRKKLCWEPYIKTIYKIGYRLEV